MKRIVTADIHFSDYYTDKEVEGLPSRLYYLKKALEDICNFARESKIKNIDIAGDLNNDKSVISTDAQNVFKDILVNYEDLNFTIISGNHDLSSAGKNQTSSISVFDEYKNVKCVVSDVYYEENIVFVPYTSNIVDVINSLEKNQILISHFGLSEGVLQSGISIVSDLKVSNLKGKFDLVILGHYHMPQKLEEDDIKLYYTGTPIHLSWRDKNQKKRFLVYDTESLEVESYTIDGFPEYKEYKLSDGNEKDNLFEQATKDKESGNFVRIENESEEKIVDENFIIVNKQESNLVDDRGISQSMSLEKLLDRYIELESEDNNIQDGEYCKEIGLEIVNGTTQEKE